MNLDDPNHPAWKEYESCARWCAARGNIGQEGEPLPANISTAVLSLINRDPEAFQDRVKDYAYAMAMDRHYPLSSPTSRRAELRMLADMANGGGK